MSSKTRCGVYKATWGPDAFVAGSFATQSQQTGQPLLTHMKLSELHPGYPDPATSELITPFLDREQIVTRGAAQNLCISDVVLLQTENDLLAGVREFRNDTFQYGLRLQPFPKCSHFTWDHGFIFRYPRRYKALKMYRKLLKRFDLQPNDVVQDDSESSTKFSKLGVEQKQLIRDARAKMEAERKHNDQLLSRAIGRPIVYGSVVQLWCSAAYAYVEVSRQAAKGGVNTDGNGLEIRISSSYGSSSAWFTVEPASSLRVPGEAVQIGDPVFLRSKKYDVYLHEVANTNTADPVQGAPVTAASSPTTFTPLMFASNAIKPPLFWEGVWHMCTVRLLHRSTGGFLTVADAGAVEEGGEPLRNRRRRRRNRAPVRYTTGDGLTAAGEESAFTAVCRVPTEAAEATDGSLALDYEFADAHWYLVPTQAVAGIPMHQYATEFVMHHSLTKRFLVVNKQESDSAAQYTVCAMELSDNNRENAAVFEAISTSNKRGFISKSSSVRLRHKESGLWLALNPTAYASVHERSTAATAATSTRPTQEEDPYYFVPVMLVSNPRNEDVFEMKRYVAMVEEYTNTCATRDAQACKAELQYFVEMLRRGEVTASMSERVERVLLVLIAMLADGFDPQSVPRKPHLITTNRMGAMNDDASTLSSARTSMESFVTLSDVEEEEIADTDFVDTFEDFLPSSTKADPRTQYMLTELGLHDTLLEVINLPLEFGVDEELFDSPQYTDLRRIYSCAYCVLLHLVTGNIRVAKYLGLVRFSMIERHSYMMSRFPRLTLSAIILAYPRMRRIMVETRMEVLLQGLKLAVSTRYCFVSYMNFMKTLCNAEGQSYPYVQFQVCKHLLSAHVCEMIVHFYMKDGVVCVSPPVLMASEMEGAYCVLGEFSDEEDRKRSVPLHEFVRTPSKIGQVTRVQLIVTSVEFFCSLATGGNRIVAALFDKFIGFDIMFSVIQDLRLPAEVRNAFFDLLIATYIDGPHLHLPTGLVVFNRVLADRIEDDGSVQRLVFDPDIQPEAVAELLEEDAMQMQGSASMIEGTDLSGVRVVDPVMSERLLRVSKFVCATIIHAADAADILEGLDIPEFKKGLAGMSFLPLSVTTVTSKDSLVTLRHVVRAAGLLVSSRAVCWHFVLGTVLPLMYRLLAVVWRTVEDEFTVMPSGEEEGIDVSTSHSRFLTLLQRQTNQQVIKDLGGKTTAPVHDQTNEVTELRCQILAESLQVLHLIGDIELNQRMSTCIKAFSSSARRYLTTLPIDGRTDYYTGPPIPALETIISRSSEADSIALSDEESVLTRPFHSRSVEEIIPLVRCTVSGVSLLATRLLLRQFQIRVDLLGALQRVNLMTSDREVRIYRRCEQTFDRMKRSFHEFVGSVHEFDPDDFVDRGKLLPDGTERMHTKPLVAVAYEASCHAMNELLSSIDQSVENDSRDYSTFRRVLIAFNCPQFICSTALPALIDVFDYIKSDPALTSAVVEGKSKALPSYASSIGLLLSKLVLVLISESEEIRESLFAAIDVLISALCTKMGPTLAQVMATMFRDNMYLVSKPSTDNIIYRLCHSISGDNWFPEVVATIRSLCLVQGLPIKRNQAVAAECVARTNHASMVPDDLLDPYDGYSTAVHMVCPLWQSASAGDTGAKDESNPRSSGQYQVDNYRCQLLMLVGDCCVGANFESETHCQHLLPLEDCASSFTASNRIVRSMLRSPGDFGMDGDTLAFRESLLYALRHVYLQTERPYNFEATHSHWWDIVDGVIEDCLSILHDRSTRYGYEEAPVVPVPEANGVMLKGPGLVNAGVVKRDRHGNAIRNRLFNYAMGVALPFVFSYLRQILHTEYGQIRMEASMRRKVSALSTVLVSKNIFGSHDGGRVSILKKVVEDVMKHTRDGQADTVGPPFSAESARRSVDENMALFSERALYKRHDSSTSDDRASLQTVKPTGADKSSAREELLVKWFKHEITAISKRSKLSEVSELKELTIRICDQCRRELDMMSKNRVSKLKVEGYVKYLIDLATELCSIDGGLTRQLLIVLWHYVIRTHGKGNEDGYDTFSGKAQGKKVPCDERTGLRLFRMIVCVVVHDTSQFILTPIALNIGTRLLAGSHSKKLRNQLFSVLNGKDPHVSPALIQRFCVRISNAFDYATNHIKAARAVSKRFEDMDVTVGHRDDSALVFGDEKSGSKSVTCCDCFPESGSEFEMIMKEIMTFVKECCEGHHEPFQNFFRHQANCESSIDFVSRIVQFLTVLESVLSSSAQAGQRSYAHGQVVDITGQCINVATKVFRTLTELVQGPCSENQKALISPDFVFASVSILDLFLEADSSRTVPVLEMKLSILTTLSAAMEGNKNPEAVRTILKSSELDSLCEYTRTLQSVLQRNQQLGLNPEDNNSTPGQPEDDPEPRNRRGSLAQAFRQSATRVLTLRSYLSRNSRSAQTRSSTGSDRPVDFGDSGSIRGSIRKLVSRKRPRMSVGSVDGMSDNGDLNSENSGYFSGSHATSAVDQLSALSMLTNETRVLFDKFGVQLYIWLRLLHDHCPEDSRHLLPLSESSMTYMHTRVCRVEVVRDGKLERMYFEKPRVCNYLRKTTRRRVVAMVKRDDPNTKVTDFLGLCNRYIIREMGVQQWLKTKFPLYTMIKKAANNVRLLVFFLALIINAMMGFGYRIKPGDDGSGPSGVEMTNDRLDTAIYAFGGLQLLACMFLLMLQMVGEASTIVSTQYKPRLSPGQCFGEVMKRDGYIRSISRAALILASDFHTTFYVVAVIMAVLGLSVSFFFFAFHLFILIIRFSLLTNVIRAVTLNGQVLLLTGVLGIVIVYVYSIVGFLYFRGDFVVEAVGTNLTLSEYHQCERLIDCFSSYLNYGLRSGGAWDMFAFNPQWDRTLLDMLFFIVVIIILLNLIFGIVLDSFAFLREQRQELIDDTRNRCFMCNRQRREFDIQGSLLSQATTGFLGGLQGGPKKSGDSKPVRYKSLFDAHIREDHNMWNYCALIVYLELKDADEHDGLEGYVRRSLEQGSIQWLPLNRAMILDETADKPSVQ